MEEKGNSAPHIFILPSSPSPTRFNNYYQLAHLFDHRKLDWEKTMTNAHNLEKEWNETGTLPNDLPFLRTCLLVQARMHRFIEGYPSELDMPYLDALVEKICSLSVDNPSEKLMLKKTEGACVVSIKPPHSEEVLHLTQTEFNRYMSQTNGQVLYWIVGDGSGY